MLHYCPFCRSEKRVFYKKGEKVFNGESVNIYKCGVCAVIYPSPRLDENESYEYLCKLCTNQGGFKFEDPTIPVPLLGDPIREYRFCGSLENFLKKYIQSLGMVLDVGAFSGRYCFIFSSMGFKVYGIEPQKNAAKFARDHGLNVFVGSFPRQLPEELLRIKFDLISFMESICYFGDLKESLLAARDMLNDKGHILIKVLLGNSRAYYNNPIFFRYGDYVQWMPTYESMKYCLENTGFKIIKTIGTNRTELLPLGIGQIKDHFSTSIFNRAYNRMIDVLNRAYNHMLLDYTLLDIKKADRLIMLAQKI